MRGRQNSFNNLPRAALKKREANKEGIAAKTNRQGSEFCSRGLLPTRKAKKFKKQRYGFAKISYIL